MRLAMSWLGIFLTNTPNILQCPTAFAVVYLPRNKANAEVLNLNASSILVARSLAAAIKGRQHSVASKIAKVTHKITHKRR